LSLALLLVALLVALGGGSNKKGISSLL